MGPNFLGPIFVDQHFLWAKFFGRTFFVSEIFFYQIFFIFLPKNPLNQKNIVPKNSFHKIFFDLKSLGNIFSYQKFLEPKFFGLKFWPRIFSQAQFQSASSVPVELKVALLFQVITTITRAFFNSPFCVEFKTIQFL